MGTRSRERDGATRYVCSRRLRSVSYIDKIVWIATYFDASRYDGRYWHNLLTKDNGLPSNFLNQVRVVKRAITNHSRLNEAYDYGSAFSRGMRIDLNGVTILLISGHGQH